MGYLLGRQRAAGKEKADEGIGVVSGRIPGLLAVVLACNLSIATLGTVVGVEIFDIGSPRPGSVRTDAHPYEWTIAGLGDIRCRSVRRSQCPTDGTGA